MNVRVLGQVAEKIGDPQGFKNEGSDSKPVSTVSTPAVIKAEPNGGRSNGVQQQPPQRQQPSSNKPGGKTNIHPIEALSPYASNWTIRALVTQKSDIRSWSNTRGEGKLFNFTLADESGEIRVTAFNQQAEDLFERVQEKKVYYVRGGKVTLAKKKFSNVQNEYELTLDRNYEVEEVRSSRRYIE